VVETEEAKKVARKRKIMPPWLHAGKVLGITPKEPLWPIVAKETPDNLRMVDRHKVLTGP
jgi:hypothetical protein